MGKGEGRPLGCRSGFSSLALECAWMCRIILQYHKPPGLNPAQMQQ